MNWRQTNNSVSTSGPTVHPQSAALHILHLGSLVFVPLEAPVQLVEGSFVCVGGREMHCCFLPLSPSALESLLLFCTLFQTECLLPRFSQSYCFLRCSSNPAVSVKPSVISSESYTSFHLWIWVTGFESKATLPRVRSVTSDKLLNPLVLQFPHLSSEKDNCVYFIKVAVVRIKWVYIFNTLSGAWCKAQCLLSND